MVVVLEHLHFILMLDGVRCTLVVVLDRARYFQGQELRALTASAVRPAVHHSVDAQAFLSLLATSLQPLLTVDSRRRQVLRDDRLLGVQPCQVKRREVRLLRIECPPLSVQYLLQIPMLR